MLVQDEVDDQRTDLFDLEHLEEDEACYRLFDEDDTNGPGFKSTGGSAEENAGMDRRGGSTYTECTRNYDIPPDAPEWVLYLNFDDGAADDEEVKHGSSPTASSNTRYISYDVSVLGLADYLEQGIPSNRGNKSNSNRLEQQQQSTTLAQTVAPLWDPYTDYYSILIMAPQVEARPRPSSAGDIDSVTHGLTTPLLSHSPSSSSSTSPPPLTPRSISESQPSTPLFQPSPLARKKTVNRATGKKKSRQLRGPSGKTTDVPTPPLPKIPPPTIPDITNLYGEKYRNFKAGIVIKRKHNSSKAMLDTVAGSVLLL
ncbi:hypothetical protein CVT26_012383 [Gymnopilus dilepis]|uniref:Uncharacterized protein n=1 Tax=Gymnopilus dilepis TaxID=231916 RepID=A0A409WAQ8_9AGAR|nr:hypothetical protein CVT26_012383 [Gymnopilus dilepis]